MSASLSHLSPNDYVYFSPRTANGCAGKPVKIHKDLAVAFITAVNPVSEEGQTVIRGIEQLTALALDTQAQATGNAAVKTKNVGCLTLCYTVTQEQGDRTPTVYITNFRQSFKSDQEKSGLYLARQERYNLDIVKIKELPIKRDHTDKVNRMLFITGLAANIDRAGQRAAARLGVREFNLFYTNGDDVKEMGAWSHVVSTKVSTDLAKILNTYSGEDITVFAEGYGAHVLHSALPQINNLSKFSFVLENPVTNIAGLIQSIDSKKGKYSNTDIVKIYPGDTNPPEFNASKVALAYSRLSLCNKVLNSGSGDNYAFVLVQLYQDTNVPTNKLDEGKKYLDKRNNFTYTTDKNIPFNTNTFIECVNKMAARR